jgi:response regulator RpfG family c-di-GMP phosphodiesterase
MPGISGMTLLERLHDAGIEIPTIVITGYGDIPMAVRAMKLGAVDFITKPVECTGAPGAGPEHPAQCRRCARTGYRYRRDAAVLSLS